MTTNVGFVDFNIEEKVLINILNDFGALESVIRDLPEGSFQNLTHQRLYDLITRYYKTYFKMLPQEALDIRLTKEPYSEKERDEISIMFLDFTHRTSDDNTRFYVDTLKDLHTKRSLVQIHSELKTGLENPTQTAEELLSKTTNQILTTNYDHSTDKIIRTTIDGDSDDRWQEYCDKKRDPAKYIGIPFGFKDIDDILGGIRPEDLGLLYSRSGVGKTRMLFNIGCNAVKTGKTVMFFTIEMSRRELQLMWESRAISLAQTGIYAGVRITHKEIEFAQLTDIQTHVYQRFLQEEKMNKVPFVIRDMPQGCTPSQIEAELLMYHRMVGKLPDLVLADYANLMTPNGKWERGWEKYDVLLRELKQISRTHYVPIVTAMQQNRESLKAASPGLEHVALSDRATDHCNWVFNVKRLPKDVEERTVQVHFVKARNAPLTRCQLYADFAINYIRDFTTVVNSNQAAQSKQADETKKF